MKKIFILSLVLLLAVTLLSACLDGQETREEAALEEIEEVFDDFSEGVYENNENKLRSVLTSEERIKFIMIEGDEINGDYVEQDGLIELLIEYVDEWELENIEISSLAPNMAEVEGDYLITELGEQFGGDIIIRLNKTDETWVISALEVYL